VLLTAQVGFHVEGVPPSPAQEATLAEQHLQAGAKVAAGSPSPVIIPPTFQVPPLPRSNVHLHVMFGSAPAASDQQQQRGCALTASPWLQSATADQLRTTSLPVDAAAGALPDSHLADVQAGHGQRSPDRHTSMDVGTPPGNLVQQIDMIWS
jgi:hypothetical protein